MRIQRFFMPSSVKIASNRIRQAFTYLLRQDNSDNGRDDVHYRSRQDDTSGGFAPPGAGILRLNNIRVIAGNPLAVQDQRRF